MVIWSQIGIAGYLLGPVLAGGVAQALGFSALGLVPAADPRTSATDRLGGGSLGELNATSAPPVW